MKINIDRAVKTVSMKQSIMRRVVSEERFERDQGIAQASCVFSEDVEK